MSDLEYSDDKVRKLKDKLYYYHHLSSLNKRDKLDLNLIPESMLFFSANNNPIDALTFYTSSLTSEIALDSDTNVDYEVLVQLNNLSYANKLISRAASSSVGKRGSKLARVPSSTGVISFALSVISPSASLKADFNPVTVTVMFVSVTAERVISSSTVN